EATGPPDAFIADVLGRRATTVTGEVTLGGDTWQRRMSDRGETSLTRTVGTVTIVVTGNARDADLERLAESLR
ncbi:MAG TPA: DUF4245 family protein, partial [Nocardioides sp.]|nr:DUF4245 family protein [Nocardioides sp.]